MAASVTIDTSVLMARLKAAKTHVKKWTPAMSEWGGGTGARKRKDWSAMTYGRLYASAQYFERSVQGSVWRKVSPQYTRKTDGAVIPPWGGVKRIERGYEHVASDIKTKRAVYGRASKVRGTVAGRKRPSGQRVKPTSIVGQDTGKMMREFTTRYLVAADTRSVKLYTVVDYADAQNELRPFNLLGPEAQKRFYVAVERQVNAAVAKANGA